MKRIYIVLLALTVGAANLQAQTYPVLVNVVVPPPVSPILSDYYAPSMRDRLIVSLHNRDLNQPTLRIRLRITVTNNGTTVAQSKPNLQMLPIDLYAGFPLRLSGSELADCFSPNNMTVNLTNGRFNPGSLQFTVEVFDAYTNQRLSNPASAFLFLHNPKPPLLNVPLQAARIPYNNGMPQFQLSWTPRNDGVAPVHYELMVRELSDTVAPPQAAFNYAPARFSQVVQGVTAYNYTLMDMPLQAAKRYGWCVRAFVPDGLDEINAFENNGYSEIRYFTIGEDCQPPLFFDAYAPDNRSMVVEWTPQVLHKAAVVDYRRYDEENWTSVQVNNPMQDTLLIERLTPGKTYLYRVGGICSNAPFYPPYHKEITVPVADSSVLANCGEPPVPFVITNFEPIASLKAGDMLTINTAKVHLLSVTGGNGVFSGEAGVVTKFMALAEVRIRVTFENIKVNTDKQIFQGKLVSVYDPNAPFIGDFGQAVHGGGVNGISNNLPAPDYLIDFTIPSVEAFSFNCENADLDCEIIITGSNGETFVIAAGRNNLGYPEIPIVIQDADGNLYQIDDENTEVDENGNPIPPPKLKASYLGKVGAPYGENDMAVDRIHTNIGRVDFFPVSGKENTFDRWKSEYQGAPEVRQAYLASLSSGANSYDRYYPPYQLVATNGTAQVKAQLSLTEFGQNFVHEDSVFFVTPTGLRYHAVYEQPTKTYTITLSGAEDRTVTEVYAIAKRHPSDQSGDLKNYYTLGKLGLANYNTNHNLKLVLVNIDGQINAATAREKLNQIYAPLGFSWEVSEDNGFDAGNAVSADSLQFTGSSWLSQYTEGMKRLHAKYRDYKGENFDESANYVFVMKNAGVSNLAGDMPRRSQFGYIFTDALGDVYRTLAHELGHGKFTLMHPIDGAYGSLKDLPNLMNTTLINDTLAKWQWDILHDPAWLVIFDKDKEGMLIKNTATGTYIPLAEKGPAFLTPSGAAIKIAGITHGEFNEDGGLLNFYLDETDLYHGAFSGELFYGYIKASDAPKIVNQHPTEELLQELDKLSFKQYSFAEQGDMVFAQAKRKRANMYTNCVCEYTWPNPKKSTGIKGTPTLPIISPTAVETNCAGVMCAGSDDGLKEGPGAVLYYNLLQTVSTDVEIDSLKSFANRMTDILKGKTFILYAEDLTDDFVTKDFTYTSLQYLIRNKINSYTKFTTDYGFKQLSNGAHDCDIIFSSVDLWEDADYETYNAGSVDWESYTLRPISNEEELFEALDRLEYIVTEIKTDQPEAISPTSYDNLLQYIYECSDTPELALQDLFHLNQTFKSIYAYLGAYNNYEYRVADLRTRQLLKQTDNVFWAYISEMERKGAAVPVSTNNSYQQYVAYYGTQSTFFLAQEYIGMIGIAYSLYGISQTVNMTGNALRGIIQQRGALRIAVSRNNLLGSKIEYDARLANNQRLAQDVKYQQYRQEKHGGDATDTKNWQDRNIGKDPVQNQIKNELCEQLYNTRGVTEIRVNQTHSSAQGKALGLNRPDIAPRYNEARYYFEIDAANSNRGIGHYQRIIANDPIAATSNTPIEIQNIVQEIALKYNCTYQINGRVILIQLQ